MKVDLLLKMTPTALARFIKFMGMPQVVGQLVTPSMLDAFMEQVAGKMAINNRVKKILAEASEAARASAVRGYNPKTDKEVAFIDGPGVSIVRDYNPKTDKEVTIIDGPGVSIVKHYDPSIGKNVTIVDVSDPVTGERIGHRIIEDGKTIMEEKVYA